MDREAFLSVIEKMPCVALNYSYLEDTLYERTDFDFHKYIDAVTDTIHQLAPDAVIQLCGSEGNFNRGDTVALRNDRMTEEDRNALEQKIVDALNAINVNDDRFSYSCQENAQEFDLGDDR